ncbi:VPLPA-CTERM sorting domain-containing protein [Meridianimarinicoccus aquatilis]|uniref:VPLPA-CTERM sorting domain-containing protein n=1 Tax=Meridianimarinicoccus aquatilis TaxID=2552766 RepID=UPI001FB60D84|nr:VPLPA-CTERM sorting domain-containing protein [Fluviibacterium aquatile]
MYHLKTIATAAVLAVAAGTAANAAVDTIQAPTGFFVPTVGDENFSPYRRGASEDWGWTHGAIAGPITSASLNISAHDVDAADGEVDNIYAYDGMTRVLLGSLAGANGVFAFTEFVLGANFYDDIATGLIVEIDIDVNNDGWLVALGKSTLTTDGSGPGNPTPTVPLPAAGWMLIAGVGGLAAMRRKKG